MKSQTTNFSKLLGISCNRCQAELNLAKRGMLPPDSKKWSCHNCGCEFSVFCEEIANKEKPLSTDVLITVYVTYRNDEKKSTKIRYNSEAMKFEREAD